MRSFNWMAQTASQALASCNNLVLTAGIIASSSVEGLGSFNLAFAIYLAALGVHRSLIVEPVFASNLGQVFVGAQRVSILCSFLVGLALVGIGLGAERGPIILVGIFLPALLLFDLRRSWALLHSRPSVALTMDVAWLAGTCCIFIVPVGAVEHAVLLWGGGCVAGLLLSVGRSVYRYDMYQSIAYYKNAARGVAGPATVDSAVYQFGWQLPVAAILDTMSVVVAGEYRLAITIMAPLGVLISSWTVSTYRAVHGAPNPGIVVPARAAGAALISIVYLFVIITTLYILHVVFPGAINIPVSLSVMIAVGMQLPFIALGGQYGIWFKVQKRARYLLLVRLSATVPVLVLVISGGLMGQSLLVVSAIATGLMAYALGVLFTFYYSQGGRSSL